jgi:hypothetical protein
MLCRCRYHTSYWQLPSIADLRCWESTFVLLEIAVEPGMFTFPVYACYLDLTKKINMPLLPLAYLSSIQIKLIAKFIH